MADDIEVGEDIEIAAVTDDDGNVVGAVIDDVIVAVGDEGAVVDEIIEVVDADGNVIAIDETISEYDADGELVDEVEVGAVAEEE
jgi:hypothetical protein